MACKDVTALFEAIPVICYSMCIRVEALDRCYPGGLAAFDQHYSFARGSPRLRAIGSICFGEAGDMVKELEEVGLKAGVDIALAEMRYGKIEGASGIEFVNVGSEGKPRWLYLASDLPAHEEVSR